MNQQRNIDLLLIGKTGHGKSATGNTILGHAAFESSSSSTSVTKKISADVSHYKEYIIKVVDGPGVGDTDTNDVDGMQMIMAEMHTALKMSRDGYTALLLVVQFGSRVTKEDGEVINQLKAIFGERLLKNHCILVFTHGDKFEKESKKTNKTFQQWYQAQTGRLADIIKECKERVVLFDNDTNDENKISAQIDNLLQMVDNLQRHGSRYRDENFEDAKNDREKAFVMAKEPLIRDEVMQETRLIMQQLEQIKARENLQDKLPLLSAQNSRVDVLIADIRTKDNGTGALHKLALTVETLKQTIESEVQVSSRMIQEEKRRKEEEEKQREEREEFERKVKEEKEELKRMLEEERIAFEAEKAKQEEERKAEQTTNKIEQEKREQELRKNFEDFKKEIKKREDKIKEEEHLRKKVTDENENEKKRLEKEWKDKQEIMQKENNEKIMQMAMDYQKIKNDLEERLRKESDEEMKKKNKKCSVL